MSTVNVYYLNHFKCFTLMQYLYLFNSYNCSVLNALTHLVIHPRLIK